MAELLERVDEGPTALLAEWIADAQRDSGQLNWNTMMLATIGSDGGPAVRAVLFKSFDPDDGSLVFYTNYRSRKAREIAADPRVALAMHWDALARQVRVEGRAERIPEAASDEYFASRPRDNQIGAWASDQSQELESWETLVARVLETAARFGVRPVPRPPHWGGYRVVPHRIELWESGEGRIHQRVRYDRAGDAWRATMLYP